VEINHPGQATAMMGLLKYSRKVCQGTKAEPAIVQGYF
jgi:hypothetical protein